MKDWNWEKLSLKLFFMFLLIGIILNIQLSDIKKLLKQISKDIQIKRVISENDNVTQVTIGKPISIILDLSKVIFIPEEKDEKETEE